MRYLILIAISLNISTAYANECVHLFESKKVISEEEINLVIVELRSLLEQIYSPDAHKSLMARDFFKTKHAELTQYITPKEIQHRIQNIKSEQKSERTKDETPQIDIVGEVVKNLAEAQEFVKHYMTPKKALRKAIEEGKHHLIHAIVSLGADPNLTDSERSLSVAINGKRHEATKRLLQYDLRLDYRDNRNMNPLDMAIALGEKEIVELLLKKGANVNERNSEGKSHLINATRKGNFEIIKSLLKYGAKVDHTDYYGNTALLNAAFNKQTNIIELLLKNGADVNQECHYGRTALHWATHHGNIEATRILLQHGANANTKALDATTPLLNARYKKNNKLIELLIKHGAKE